MKSPKSSGKPKRLKRPRGFLIRRVAGESMLPGLRPGQIVLVMTRYRTLRVGDVVVFGHAGLEKIKRIARIEPERSRLFLLGDNPARSTDSRTLGWFELTSVRGKVVWPRTAKQI